MPRQFWYLLLGLLVCIGVIYLIEHAGMGLK